MLPSEKKKLSEKAKKMADKYSWIVFTHTSIGNKGMGKNNSFMQFKKEILMNQKADKAFYETMMTFSVKVLSNAFDKNDIPKLEEEVSRLFRSSAFNIATRTQQEESKKKKYPQLKECQNDKDKEDLIKRMEMRFKVPKETKHQSLLKSKTEIRPLF